MKIGKRNTGKATKPDKNSSRKNFLLAIVLIITILLIVWVYTLGRKAEETVSVVMLAESVYKNEVITESKLKEYQMLKGEFEKYATTTSSGQKKRRIVLWEERGQLINTFAAYPLQQDTVAMWNNFMTTRIDNSDSVLYSFPGKNIVRLEIGDSELDTFKTFLQPGDRINITAIYQTTDTITLEDSYGNTSQQQVEVYKEEQLFTDIMLADLLNGDGDSILDLYASYNEKTTYQQAALDSSEDWKEQTEPSAMLVALTPEEETLYYKYLAKRDVEFKVSLPQRED